MGGGGGDWSPGRRGGDSSSARVDRTRVRPVGEERSWGVATQDPSERHRDKLFYDFIYFN